MIISDVPLMISYQLSDIMFSQENYIISIIFKIYEDISNETGYKITIAGFNTD